MRPSACGSTARPCGGPPPPRPWRAASRRPPPVAEACRLARAAPHGWARTPNHFLVLAFLVLGLRGEASHPLRNPPDVRPGLRDARGLECERPRRGAARA